MSEFADKIKHMLGPHKWPHRPFLPLRRFVKGKEELGFLYVMPRLIEGANRKLAPTVYLGSIFHPDKEAELLTHDEVMKLTRLSYHTFSSIVFDGWEVIHVRESYNP